MAAVFHDAKLVSQEVHSIQVLSAETFVSVLTLGTDSTFSHRQLSNFRQVPIPITCSPVCIPVKLCNEDLHNFYSSPNIIRVVKLRTMKFVGYVACIRKKRNA